MQTEPEMSIQWMSPEYFCQLAAISSIARDLPAGMPLVVKDNIYALGKRPKNFFKNLRLFKNVDIMSVKERGPDVISASTIIITISGTVGIEAAMMGRPVILFGRHNQYDKFLPNVRFVEKEEHLAEEGNNDYISNKFNITSKFNITPRYTKEVDLATGREITL